tara:strand:- start:283 stop:825 length:543 start_codon:yes stop_codon:yes gene_type:complete
MAFTTLPTSSYSTLDATKLTGNLPAISGASLTGITTGTVLQVKSGASIGGNNASSNTSFTSTSTTFNITPTKASSKIFVSYVIPTNTAQANTSCKTRIYRQINSGGFSNISNNTTMNNVYINGASNSSQLSTLQWLDTPTYSLTDVLHYMVYFASSDGGTVNIYNEFGNGNHLTLMEIAT